MQVNRAEISSKSVSVSLRCFQQFRNTNVKSRRISSDSAGISCTIHRPAYSAHESLGRTHENGIAAAVLIGIDKLKHSHQSTSNEHGLLGNRLSHPPSYRQRFRFTRLLAPTTNPSTASPRSIFGFFVFFLLLTFFFF